MHAFEYKRMHKHTIARYINSAHIFLCMPAKLDLSSYAHGNQDDGHGNQDDGHGTPGPEQHLLKPTAGCMLLILAMVPRSPLH